jgi:hypothetical protein
MGQVRALRRHRLGLREKVKVSIHGRTFVPQPDGTVTYQGMCALCGEPSAVSGLIPSQVAAFADGAGLHVQDAFPQLSADDRETILSGSHGSCFDTAFPPDDEEEDPEPSWWPWS